VEKIDRVNDELKVFNSSPFGEKPLPIAPLGGTDER
jgi:hypothetical protein